MTPSSPLLAPPLRASAPSAPRHTCPLRRPPPPLRLSPCRRVGPRVSACRLLIPRCVHFDGSWDAPFARFATRWATQWWLDGKGSKVLRGDSSDPQLPIWSSSSNASRRVPLRGNYASTLCITPFAGIPMGYPRCRLSLAPLSNSEISSPPLPCVISSARRPRQPRPRFGSNPATRPWTPPPPNPRNGAPQRLSPKTASARIGDTRRRRTPFRHRPPRWACRRRRRQSRLWAP